MKIGKSAFLLGMLFMSFDSYSKELPPVNVDEAKRDCRTEGEAGGMQGDDLDAFISECVEELLEYQYQNSV
jgi:hypothetical protein